MGSQEHPAPSGDLEPAAKRVKLDPEAEPTLETVTKEPPVKVNGYALIKEEYVSYLNFRELRC